MKRLLFTFFSIFFAFYGFSDELKNDQKYYDIISSVLNSINYYDGTSLYETQQILMFPLMGAFEMNDEKIIHLLINGLNNSLDNMTELGKLRNDAGNKLINLDEKLLNSALSGDDQRKIFPVFEKNKKKVISKRMPYGKEGKIIEAILSELQFL